MTLTDIANVLKLVGTDRFVIVLLAFIAATLLTSLIARVKWVLANMVPLSVHQGVQKDLCEQLADIHSDTRLLVDRGKS